MAGNSSRRGAIKKTGKGNPTAGSGGRVRRGLEGKGPTPKAKDRPYHKAHKQAKRAEKSVAGRPMMRAAARRPCQIAGRVTQIISGSIGLDDWEWGVDLFADRWRVELADPRMGRRIELAYDVKVLPEPVA